MIFYNNEICNNIDKNLNFIIPNNILQEEFNYFKNAIPQKYSLVCNNHNKIIRFFQQNIFYHKEKELWQNDIIKAKIIENRHKYLNIPYNLISSYDIITGFKKSGIYYGFSGFNPLLIKKFCLDYNIQTLYDPCGGWGHRLLGCLNIQRYIYNDLSLSTYNNVNDIINFFDIHNVITYNNDCQFFTPSEQFEAIFTCPPYYNLEHYECGDFKNIQEFNIFLDNIFNIFYNSSAHIFGLVIREDLINTHVNYNKKILLNVASAKHFNKNKKFKEYLFIYMK